ncbi:MAG: type II toxin-antitoxin system VapC family toxin [Methylacidiphilales bacterium]|nr:type II toxin-antitoxin system VapC family toxin [Candidatus Methylacidiphilales bacterium]
MIAYPDTSFLVALYRWQVNSPEAVAHFQAMSEALHISSLLLFEFRQSIRLQEFLHRRNSRLGFDHVTGQRALADMQSDIASGVVVLTAADWNDVIQIAERVSNQHTSPEGYRSFDILNVATALHFGAREFLTFDANQKKLAKAEGLKIPL